MKKKLLQALALVSILALPALGWAAMSADDCPCSSPCPCPDCPC